MGSIELHPSENSVFLLWIHSLHNFNLFEWTESSLCVLMLICLINWFGQLCNRQNLALIVMIAALSFFLLETISL